MRSRIALEDGLRVIPHVSDIRQLADYQTQFDAIVAITSIDHLCEAEIGPTIDQIHELTKEGGFVCILVHTRDDPGFLQHVSASETSGWVEHYFRRRELRRRVGDQFLVTFYEEWEEVDRDHGPLHKHCFAGVIAEKRGSA